ncbi:MAG: hypothetical protein ABIC18_05340 [Candidatus Omnitrophota bacterium]
MKKINCLECPQKEHCCKEGVWVDLKEARNISSLRLCGGFYNLKKDKKFPSGYKVDTSYENNPCSFLTADGLCSIHKVDYNLKPTYCKEFPYEDGKIAPYAKELCLLVKHKRMTIHPKKSFCISKSPQKSL